MKELSDRKTRELGVVRSEIEASYGAFVEAHRDTMSRLTSAVTSARDEVRPTARVGPIKRWLLYVRNGRARLAPTALHG